MTVGELLEELKGMLPHHYDYELRFSVSLEENDDRSFKFASKIHPHEPLKLVEFFGVQE